MSRRAVNVFSFPLKYLSLEDEQGGKLYRRDLIGIAAIALAISVPFWFAGAAYFGEKGFLDRFSSFSGVLTGFYVAALVGVASFATTRRGMDEVIEVGKVLDPRSGANDQIWLTRRQYVCALFGYLAFIALTLSLAAIVLVSIAVPTESLLLSALSGWEWAPAAVRGAVIFAINFIIAHMMATTCHGLYYLIDRLYAEKAEPNPKPERAPET